MWILFVLLPSSPFKYIGLTLFDAAITFLSLLIFLLGQVLFQTNHFQFLGLNHYKIQRQHLLMLLISLGLTSYSCGSCPTGTML